MNKDLENQIKEIVERNKNVELDKKWETSFFRKIVLAILTFLILWLYMYSIWIEKPFLNAFIPTCWFLISTLSLLFFRKIWEKYIITKKQ